MDAFLLVLGLGVLAVPLAIVLLWIGQRNLRRRIATLELALNAAVENSAIAPLGAPVQGAAALADVSGKADFAVHASEGADVPDAKIFASIDPAPEPSASSAWDRASKSAASGPAQDPVLGAVDQNRPIVMRADRLQALLAWLRLNWVYALSALSLALAGVFFVQYGVEKGLLPPAARVLAALVFGAALIGAGEWLRRRHGDEGTHKTAYLPSVFSGAGLVAIFAAVLAARQMYGLIGPEVAFAGHVLTALLALVLGWFYGPLLAGFGLLGAAASPFIVAGGSQAGAWLYGYFALIAVVGLAVDAVRRWAWVSVLALALGFAGSALAMVSGAGIVGWVGVLIALAVLATVVPPLQLVPRHQGPAMIRLLMGKAVEGWPPFPVRLAAGSVLASTLAMVLLAASPQSEAMLALIALTLLALAYLFWAEHAEGLMDLAYLPAIGLVISIGAQGFGHFPILQHFWAQAPGLRGPEVAAPLTISLLLGMVTLVGLGFAWRSFHNGPFRMLDTLAAVLLAPVSAAMLDLLWQPATVIGAYAWALQVIALAALVVGLALRYAKADGVVHRRFALATLSAMALIALALFLVSTDVALTLALAVLAVVAAGLDRKFELPEMRFFIQISAAVLWYRLFGNPGIDWAMVAPIGKVILAFGGVIAAFAAALKLLEPLDRPTATGVLESAAAGLIVVLLNILLTRKLIPEINTDGLQTYWGATVNAMPWSILMLVQLYRVRLGGPIKRVRQGIALVSGFVAGGGLLLAAGPYNPVVASNATETQGLIEGPMVFDSLALAYAMPGALLLVAGWKIPGLKQAIRLGFMSFGSGLLALYLALEIRRFWQGNWLGKPDVQQGELYNYTVALMLVGAGLLYLAIARKSDLVRRIAMAVIAFTIVKVFLLDAAGLTGLTRVASFLGLGLSLAALAWLNRWAGQVSLAKAGEEPAAGSEQ